MDKAAIKTFAINSRRKLMEDVEYRMSLVGISKDGIQDSISDAEGIQTFDIGGATHSIYDEDIKKRENLIKEVNNKGFDNVVEEVAYTWFNRIIAIRFMEVNDYLPTKTRVLSSETLGKTEPDIINEAFNIDLDYTEDERQQIFNLKDENKLDELFRFLFIKQCNKLNDILPGLFEKTEDFMELLLNISFVNSDGVVRNLVDTISEEDFTNQVEIIGWLYQFYNAELKDEIFTNLKKNVKINKEKIPAATQLFTPDWIVKYMVENSLGKLWIQNNPNENLKSNWSYYIEDTLQDEDVELKLLELKQNADITNIEDIKVIDPCCGSGHILVYIFDVLMQIYVSEGYTEKDAAVSILKNNLFGIDIDDRAYQLSYFAVMMKARNHNRRILTKNIHPMILSIQESNNLNESVIDILSSDDEVKRDLKYLLDIFYNAKNFGSILNIEKINFERLYAVLNNVEKNSSNLSFINYQKEFKLIKYLIKQAEYLYNKYDVVVTNPPYMGNSGMNQDLKDYLKENYPLSKSDLFAVFLEKGLDMVKDNCFNCMVTMQSWMFLSSFEKLRKDLLNKSYISNLLHMENMVMGIAFGTSATVFRKTQLPKFRGAFNQIKLRDIGEENVPTEFPVSGNRNMFTSSNNFSMIPGSPIAYWADKHVFDAFQNGTPLIDIGDVKQGLATADNNRFLRLWYEVDSNNIGLNYGSCDESKNSNLKWFPYNKGGYYRKWYGNQEFVINWENDGFELRNFKKAVLRNSKFYFQKSLSWSKISSGSIAFRHYPKGFLFDVAGCSVFVDEDMEYIMGFLNSNVSKGILDMISPTLNYEVGHVSSVPIIFGKNNEIGSYVRENIQICKDDWDDYETSWEFKSHPLIRYKQSTIEESFKKWKEHKLADFNKLKSNEIELNKIFSEIYSIDVDSNVEDKYVSVTKADYEKDIKSFISYAVGCMFGRYDFNKDGLIFAGGEFNLNNYSSFIPDDDNVIPVLDTEYFEDDIVGYFIEFVKIVWGEDSLEENLNFIANGLSDNNQNSKDIIRNYFLNEFSKNHIKIFNKCPIYWQFSSGKENGFNCLVYMHRYDSNLVARVRTDYLHKTQKKIEEKIDHWDNILNNSNIASEKSKATKEKNKLIKQLAETREYDEALAHIANQNIEIDLDDGVKLNYAKFQNVPVRKEGQQTKKINLLKKI